MSASPLKIVLGGGAINSSFGSFSDDKVITEIYSTLDKYSVKNIDTARFYGDSEVLLGQTGGASRFTIDTKTPGGLVPGGSTSVTIPEHAKESIEKLKTTKVDVFYIHCPDPSVDLADMLKGVNDAHQAGRFDRFGLSNFSIEDVQRVYDICKEKGYTLPKVYQGSYSPVGRKPESELIPLLRKLGMAYYVYSPLAGGFLTKTKQQVIEKTATRFKEGHIMATVYDKLYNHEAHLNALDLWAEAAELAGCSRAELGYRWVTYDAPLSAADGDAIIIGCSSVKQLEQTLEGLKKGSVGEAAKKKIDEIWKSVEHEAVLDFNNE